MQNTTTRTMLPLAPGHWAVDCNQTAVGFTIRHLDVSRRPTLTFRSDSIEVDVQLIEPDAS